MRAISSNLPQKYGIPKFVFYLFYDNILDMEPEDKKMLEKIYELAEENNEMLHKVRSVQKRQYLFQIIRWALIIGISIGAFYFLQPYVDNFQYFLEDTSETIEKIKNFGS
jgi:hypothetical protein